MKKLESTETHPTNIQPYILQLPRLQGSTSMKNLQIEKLTLEGYTDQCQISWAIVYTTGKYLLDRIILALLKTLFGRHLVIPGSSGGRHGMIVVICRAICVQDGSLTDDPHNPSILMYIHLYLN